MSVRQVEAAAGTKGSPGVVLLLAPPRGSSASASRIAGVTHRLRRVGGIARTAGPAAVSRDGRRVLVTGTLHAGADDATTARSVQSAFRAARDVTVGGSVVANQQIGSAVGKDLGRAELLALPLLVVLSLVFFRGRAALMPVVVGLTQPCSERSSS